MSTICPRAPLAISKSVDTFHADGSLHLIVQAQRLVRVGCGFTHFSVWLLSLAIMSVATRIECGANHQADLLTACMRSTSYHAIPSARAWRGVANTASFHKKSQ